MRLSHRIPKRSATALESPSNANAIALLKDKNQVKILRQIHQQIIASASDQTANQDGNQNKIYGHIHPTAQSHTEEIKVSQLDQGKDHIAVTETPAVFECNVPDLIHICGKCNDSADIDIDSIPHDTHALICHEDSATDECFRQTLRSATGHSEPVTPIPMTQLSLAHANWSGHRGDASFSLDTPQHFGKAEIEVRKSYELSIPTVEIKALDANEPCLSDDNKIAKTSMDSHEVSGANPSSNRPHIVARKNGNTGSTQFQQRLRALKQAGLIDTRTMTPVTENVGCDLEKSEITAVLAVAGDDTNHNMKSQVGMLAFETPQHSTAFRDPAAFDSISAAHGFTPEEEINHRSHLSLIGVHRFAHEEYQNQSGKQSRGVRGDEPLYHAESVSTKIASRFTMGPVEPKEASPFLYPLTFLKHMFSPYSAGEVSTSNEPASIHHASEKANDSDDSDSSNSFSFFSSVDKYPIPVGTSSCTGSERPQIKIQMSRRPDRSATPMQDSSRAHSDCASHEFPLCSHLGGQEHEERVERDHVRGEQKSCEGCEGKVFGISPRPFTPKELTAGAAAATIHHGIKLDSPFHTKRSAAPHHAINEACEFTSPSNVEEALWDEFERQPSIQLLHSIRTDLHCQLSSIISKLEQSLADSCAERSTRTAERGGAEQQGGPQQDGAAHHDGFRLSREGRPDGPTEALHKTTSSGGSTDAATSKPRNRPILDENDSLQQELHSSVLKHLLSPGGRHGLIEVTGPSMHQAEVCCETLKLPAAAHTMDEDKENVVNASAGIAGAKWAKNRARGTVALRLAVRENDLWC
jgi:hypothetical protein